MMRTKQLSMIVGALATAAVFAFSSQANAGWGSSGGWGSSSSGGYGGWGSSSSSGGGWGSSSSGGGRHHGWRRSWRGSSSSSSGGWGRRGWGSSSSSGGYSYSSSSSGGYSYGGSSSSGGYSYGGSSSSGGSTYHAEGNWVPAEDGHAPAPPAEGDAPTDAPVPPSDPEASIRERNTTVSFSVNVPEDTQIFVNGNATTSTGAERTYISRGLTAGKSYTFHVRAELVRDGKTLTETKKVRLAAGQHSMLAFEFAPNANEQLADKPVETKLTLKVPADAKVYLSGHATAATGEVREFATTKLISGKAWADYVVVVTYEKDGQLLSQEKNVTINAGDSREVTFDFDHDKVAVNN